MNIEDRADIPPEWFADADDDKIIDVAQSLLEHDIYDDCCKAAWRDCTGAVYTLIGKSYRMGQRYVVWTTSDGVGDDDWYVVDANSAEEAAEEHARNITEDLDEGPQSEPSCDHEDGHNWSRDLDLVGGCTENPGVWSTGGTSICTIEICTRCGMKKEYNSYGFQRNPGEYDGTTYSNKDGEKITWIADI